MNYFIRLAMLFVVAAGTLFSCSGDDDANSATRSSGSINVFLDGSAIATNYNLNITAADMPLPQTTGVSTVFKIEAQALSGDSFRFSLAPSTTTATQVTTPFTEQLNGPVSQRLRIDNLVIDDSAANALTINYTQFGANTGDPIKIRITGTYFLTSSITAHTIDCQIDITRD